MLAVARLMTALFGTDAVPRRVALIGTAYKKTLPLIRYSTLRRRQLHLLFGT